MFKHCPKYHQVMQKMTTFICVTEDLPECKNIAIEISDKATSGASPAC